MVYISTTLDGTTPTNSIRIEHCRRLAGDADSESMFHSLAFTKYIVGHADHRSRLHAAAPSDVPRSFWTLFQSIASGFVLTPSPEGIHVGCTLLSVFKYIGGMLHGHRQLLWCLFWTLHKPFPRQAKTLHRGRFHPYRRRQIAPGTRGRNRSDYEVRFVDGWHGTVGLNTYDERIVQGVSIPAEFSGVERSLVKFGQEDGHKSPDRVNSRLR